jgi:hypothetical protein
MLALILSLFLPAQRRFTWSPALRSGTSADPGLIVSWT